MLSERIIDETLEADYLFIDAYDEDDFDDDDESLDDFRR